MNDFEIVRDASGAKVKRRMSDARQSEVDDSRAESLTVDEINSEIDKLLAATDWTQMSDADLSPQDLAAFNGYRAELRAADRSPRPRDLNLPTIAMDTNRNGR